jgi:hypothetical protein
MTSMNYQTRLVLWAGKLDNVAQKETDGSTSYFFGQSSHINVRTLSGTHAHRERKPAKRITTARATPGRTWQQPRTSSTRLKFYWLLHRLTSSNWLCFQCWMKHILEHRDIQHGDVWQCREGKHGYSD